MISENDFVISSYSFNSKLFDELYNHHYARNNWPVVYILSDGTTKEAYVGETSDTFARLATHLKNNTKNKLTSVRLVTSDRFNKSATLDIESNLIKYISGDGQYRLLNLNLGLANHQFYEKLKYWSIFRSLWDKLRAEGLTKHSIEHIDNSDLFKYSPYKSLAAEQKQGLKLIIRSLLDPNAKRVIVEGGAGTGKSILAIFLFKLLKTDISGFNFKDFGEEEAELIDLVTKLKEKYPNPKMALVIPMSSFRKTIQKVFKNIKGLKSTMVIGPSEMTSEQFDIIIVDESHRLRRRKNLGSYYEVFDKTCAKLDLDKHTASELHWVILQSHRSVLFYDQNQSIKPSDTRKEDFDKLKLATGTSIEKLKSQFRVKGGHDYITYVRDLLSCSMPQERKQYRSNDYEFLMFDDLDEMITQIKARNESYGLARLVAGFAWVWKTKSPKNRHLIDIQIGDTALKWNSVAIDWPNSPNAINEVGCIHTTQGYDLNYTGVIFGPEISYDEAEDEIVVVKENYHDKNGKNAISDPAELKSYILNIYDTILKRGIRGTYVYVCDPKLRAYFAKHIPAARPVIADTVNQLIPFVNSVPLYDLHAAAGSFSELQHVDDYDLIEVPENVRVADDMFACRVVGESMNRVIPNGSICLFRKYSAGSRNGKIVLAESTAFNDSDFGSGYTVKEYSSVKRADENGWEHESITLKPLSNDPSYKSITLSEDELVNFKVVGIFERVLSL
ncbi:DNA/RNA helicase domain-containing protein [Pedobacter sp. JY14-1]|uniref:DNA/RNA helicase domain-containing protein n=1 Tax=Pedobacter sp. JY14-1 TaxID=3034151 RepID=UPI0023E1F74C|nr:DNA/RNA helicase domain-containing protein [Pedobacter sp. JY14-1]